MDKDISRDFNWTNLPVIAKKQQRRAHAMTPSRKVLVARNLRKRCTLKDTARAALA